MVEKWTSKVSKFDVMAALNEVDVPCGPILSMKDLIEDESLYQRGYLVELEHPQRGNYVQLGCPITMSASPVQVERSPLLGEHTDEILEWLGRTPAQISAMKLAGAV
ncbi:Formyl-CoA:oxalate CoA-transferase [compost metagenome]